MISNNQQIELRFSANNLANKDFLSLSDPFLVCHSVADGYLIEKIGRTETVKDDLNPVWTTTISFTHNTSSSPPNLLVDIFDRDSTTDHKLTKHDFLGRALIRMHHVLASPDLSLTLRLVPAPRIPLLPLSRSRTMSNLLRRPSLSGLPRTCSTLSTEDDDEDYVPMPAAPDLKRATMTSRALHGVKGTLSVYAELLKTPAQGVPVVFRVSSALLKEIGGLHRKVTQFYELQRERPMANGDLVWSCVYRSKDGVNVTRENYVEFSSIALTEAQLHNMQPTRRLRLVFYKRNTRSTHEMISYCVTSMADLMDVRTDERKAIIPMEGTYSDDTGLGNVIVTRVEKTTSNAFNPNAADEIRIDLRADHFLHRRFTSSLNDSPKYNRKLRQVPKFLTLH